MTSKAQNQFKSLYQKGLLSAEDIIVIKAWLNEMEEEGPEYIHKSKRWNDHPLHSEWEGFRASCFSGPGRIIYRIIHDLVIIEIHRVTASHDYKKRTP